MATASRAADRNAARAVPLLRAYWTMPLVAGAAVIVTAAFMLIEVLVLESKIQGNVTPIVNSVSSIKTHTDDIRILTSVDAVAKDIRTAADPLSGQAATILGTVGVIQGTVGTIDSATGSINSHAAGIDSMVNGNIAPHVEIINVQAANIRDRGPGGGLTRATGQLAQALSLLQAGIGDLNYLAGNVVPRILADATSIDRKLP
ncbi:MAG: hypothetical protein ABR564_08640 [Candidatus Dormibacteria bacterium]